MVLEFSGRGGRDKSPGCPLQLFFEVLTGLRHLPGLVCLPNHVSRSLAGPCWSAYLSVSFLLSLPVDHTLPRYSAPSQSLPFPENYQTLPKSTQHPSGGSSPPPRNLPSDYKYAQDRASHRKMSNEERRAHRDGTVWQLYEWQQRQQFRHGSPTAPISVGSPEFTDHGRSRSMLEVPRSISVPPSPSDIPPPGPPRVFPPRRPHTPAERVTVKPPDQRRSVDISLGGSPRKAWGYATKVRLEPCLAAGVQH